MLSHFYSTFVLLKLSYEGFSAVRGKRQKMKEDVLLKMSSENMQIEGRYYRKNNTLVIC